MFLFGNGYRNTKSRRSPTKMKISEFMIYESLIKVGSKLIWLWIVIIEPEHRQIIQIDISFERNMIIAERFVSSLINEYGKYPISTAVAHMASSSL
jgi:transposase-like protein